MKLHERLSQAVREQDAATVGRIADRLRGMGATYQDILAFAQKHVPGLTSGEWDDLLSESEDLEAS